MVCTSVNTLLSLALVLPTGIGSSWELRKSQLFFPMLAAKPPKTTGKHKIDPALSHKTICPHFFEPQTVAQPPVRKNGNLRTSINNGNR
nr:hypothetical protein CFP56_61479 [Quercus suber]